VLAVASPAVIKNFRRFTKGNERIVSLFAIAGGAFAEDASHYCIESMDGTA
jgi:hypothetical protein